MDRLTALHIFSDIAETGSFTATAERLELSRAMVTRAIAELEQWLGARLLQRTTRRVTLTEAGIQCLRRSQQMLALRQDMEEEITPTDSQLRGQLRLTSSMSFGHAHLAAALGDFLERHPQLKIDLDVGDRAVNLVEARIDLAIRISAEPDPALIARPLAECTSMLVASPGYLAQHPAILQPGDLLQHRCLGHSNFGRSEWRLSRAEESIEIAVSCRFTANEATVLREAAFAGSGIALLPTYLVAPAVSAGHLVQVLPAWQLPRLTIHALYASRRHLSPAVRALVDFLVERFATPRWQEAY
ncbi:LysR family transcriptional regulator [Dechloromonas denitrificans]|uniref:LysR family transcriptional regulator n=1 Tax=Dechloromonas denitrificans TaxID=281362 RepID=UPI001CF8AA9A|nr:LysR family transcriptional regulator [Dechloromonas denitrificans]UCV12485.1 LysR family transcriptional regulator [Dechloromonas denitrificans]